MTTPLFWNSKNFLSTMLLPIAMVYEIVSTLKQSYSKPETLPIPVICVGNVTVGGSGKTPVALHIGQLLKDKNVEAFFLSRGYGGKLKGPVLVDPEKHTAAEVGDEPLLLAKILPTIVAKDRALGADMAIKLGAKAIVMDDGFQNPSIAKSLSLLVIDGHVAFGNGRLLPSGPLRERPAAAIKRAHALVVINRTTRLPPLPSDRPVFNVKATLQDPGTLKGRKVIAFCGIAYPQKFFDMLNSAGAMVVEKVAFDDHHPYRKKELDKLILKASDQRAVLVTTPKDAMRVPLELRDCMAAMDITLEFDQPEVLSGILDYILTPNEKA